MLELLVASVEMYLSFVSCREEDRYQLRLVLLLVKVRRRRKVSTVISPDLFASLEDFGHLFYLTN